MLLFRSWLVAILFSLGNGSELITFWHVTDFHLDLNYSEIGDVNFHCHFDQTNTDLPKFGISNSTITCDTPYVLAHSAIKAMNATNPNPDFIIWTGDSAPHLPDSLATEDWVINTLSNLTQLFHTYFPTTKLYSVFGNHDYWPTDQFPTTTSRIYKEAADMWGKDLSPEAKNNLSQYSYYRQDMDKPKNTILLGLNTNLIYFQNNKTLGMDDPAGQFAFMESSLNEARQNGKKVMIISHIPPGVWWPKWYSLHERHNDRLAQTLANYSDVIIGSYFGHNHKDQIMLLKNDSDDSFISWLLAAPAVNTWMGEGRNPAFRQIQIDSDTGDVRGLKQFWMNLTDANLSGNDTWMEHYTITVPTDKTFLQYLIGYFEEFRYGDPGKMWEYIQREMVKSTDLAPCNINCTKEHICGISELMFKRYDRCLNEIVLTTPTITTTPTSSVMTTSTSATSTVTTSNSTEELLSISIATFAMIVVIFVL